MEIYINELRQRINGCPNLNEILQRHNMTGFDPLIFSHYTDVYSNSAIRGFLIDLGYNIADGETVTIVAFRYGPICD